MNNILRLGLSVFTLITSIFIIGFLDYIIDFNSWVNGPIVVCSGFLLIVPSLWFVGFSIAMLIIGDEE